MARHAGVMAMAFSKDVKFTLELADWKLLREYAFDNHRSIGELARLGMEPLLVALRAVDKAHQSEKTAIEEAAREVAHAAAAAATHAAIGQQAHRRKVQAAATDAAIAAARKATCRATALAARRAEEACASVFRATRAVSRIAANGKFASGKKRALPR